MAPQHPLFLGHNYAEVTILNGGNVGIGLSDPAQKLHVKDTSGVSYNGATDLDGESLFTLEAGNADQSTSMIRWKNHGNMNNYFGCVQQGASGAADFVWTIFNGSAYAERMRLDKSGNLGVRGTATFYSAITANDNSSYIECLSTQEWGLRAQNDGAGGGILLRRNDNTPTNTAILGKIGFGNRSHDDILATISAYADGETTNASLRFATEVHNGALTERMRIKSTGEVGIGTDNPLSPLHVKGGDSDSIMRIENPGTGQVGIVFKVNTSDRVAIWEDTDLENGLCIGTAGGSPLMFVNTQSSKVGIGTTSPSGNFTINAAPGDVSMYMHTSGTGVTDQDGMEIFMRAANDFGGIHLRENARFDIAVNGDTRMCVKPDGKVGIGTLVPDTALHVEANTTSSSSSVYPNITIENPSTATGSYAGLFIISGSNKIHHYTSLTEANMNLTANFPLSIHHEGTSRLFIKGDGKVGIGTAAPSGVLEIKSTASDLLILTQTTDGNAGLITFKSGTQQEGFIQLDDGVFTSVADGGNAVGYFNWLTRDSGAGLSTKMTLLNDGNVGIGTASPNNLLHIYAPGGSDAACHFEVNGENNFTIGVDSTDDKFKIANHSGGELQTNTRMTIDTNGKVGIGIAAPGAKFHATSDTTAYAGDGQIGLFNTHASWSNAKGVLAVVNLSTSQNGTDTQLYVQSNSTAGALARFFGNTTTEVMTILANGNSTFAGTITAGSATLTGNVEMGGELNINPSTNKRLLFNFPTDEFSNESRISFSDLNAYVTYKANPNIMEIWSYNSLYLQTGATPADTLVLTQDQNATFLGSIIPAVDNTKDLGSSALRWANLYVADMHLKNDRGDWTVIEEEEYLSLKNNKNGKVYKLIMEEV